MEYIKVKDLFTISKGKKVEALEYKNDEAIRYIQIDDLRNDDNLKYCENNTKYVIANREDIIIAWDGANAGTIGFGLEGAIGSTLAVLRKQNSEMNSEFCGLFLRSKSSYLREKCTGATIPHIQKSVLENIQIPKFDIDMQIKIVEIIKKSQELIDKRKEQIDQLDELVKSRFIEMFGDPIINSKGLKVKNFEEVVRLQRGFDLPTYARNENGIYNVWGSNGILSKHSTYKVDEPGIVTGRSGSLGKVYYTTEPYWPLNTTLFSKNTYGNNVVYLAYLLRFYKLERFSNGTGVPTLNRNLLDGKKIIDTPLEKQNEFAEFVKHVDKLKFEMEKSLKELEDNFNSLMQKAFKGELF